MPEVVQMAREACSKAVEEAGLSEDAYLDCYVASLEGLISSKRIINDVRAYCYAVAINVIGVIQDEKNTTSYSFLDMQKKQGVF